MFAFMMFLQDTAETASGAVTDAAAVMPEGSLEYGSIGLSIMYLTNMIKDRLLTDEWERFVPFIPFILSCLYTLTLATGVGETMSQKVMAGIIMGAALAGTYRTAKVATKKKEK